MKKVWQDVASPSSSRTGTRSPTRPTRSRSSRSTPTAASSSCVSCRVATGGELLELPAGLIDEGEEPLQTAKRELREETGLRGGNWRELASFWTSPGFMNERVTVFVADGLEEGEPEPDEDEELEIVRWTLAEVEERLHELEDATTLIGLLLYLRG